MSARSEVKNILLCGVGGQGTILTSRILTEGLIRAGYDVKMSEVHGMAQRGGSVSTQVRYGEKVNSPLFGRGQADVCVAFERMEAVRYAGFLKPGGICVVNDYRLTPMSVAVGGAAYPENAVAAMEAAFETIAIPAADVAAGLGNARTMNVVLFGALVRALGLAGLPGVDWEDVIKSLIPGKLLAVNLEAFRAGLRG
ncbi:MAG: indolepyruvate oxidoreductase subunit beta [Clostridiales Family XIII bacterium]|jgi:indolepyruvate ferredoxin oxidoreductase beta subunit|nr:indolepyruvate oxidoreductase subunit beta [Clostridiales Family XIII bacterium]